MRRLVYFVAVLALICFALPVSAVNVTQCQSIGLAGVYLLNVSLVANGPTCFSITASDVDFSCFSASTGMQSNLTSGSYAVATSGSLNNVSVHGCTISAFGNGISIAGTTNSNVSYNNIANLTDNGAQGVNIGSSNFSFVGFNTISNVTTTGVIAAGVGGGSANNSRVQNNVIQNFFADGARGIVIDTVGSSRNHTVSGNSIQNLNGTGIETHGFNVTVSSNTVLNASGGIYHEGNDSVISGNTVANSTRGFNTGITVENAFANTNVTSNTVSTVSRGIDFRSNSSLIAHNVVSNITTVQEGGISVGWNGATGTTGNTIYNNTVRDTMPAVAVGAAIGTSGNNYNASYNTVSNWNGSGISITGDNGRLSFNTVTGINGINAWALQYQGQFGTISSNTVANMTGQSVNGFFSNNLNDSSFTLNTFRNFTGPFSVATSIGQDPAQSQNVTVFSNTVTDVNGTGLGAYGASFNISYNTVTGASASVNGQSLAYFGEFGIIQSNTVANITASGNIGIRAYYSNHTRILSNTVENFNLGSTAIQIEDEARSRNNTVSQNVVRNFNGTGLNVFSNNATVSLNTLTNLTANNANGIFYQGINGSVTQNTIANSTLTFFVGIMTSASVADNINITSNTLTNLTARGIDFRGNNSRIEFNTFTNWAGVGGAYVSVIEVVWGGIQNVTVHNNTISNSMIAPFLNPAISLGGRNINASYNTIRDYNGTAFSMGSSTNSFALWNTILNFSQGNGFAIESSSSNNIIAFNTIANASGAAQSPAVGVQFDGLNNNFSYNTVTNINSTTFVFNGASSGARVQNNVFSNGRGNGIQFNTNANDNWVVDNQILNFTNFAVLISNSLRNTFSRNTFNQSMPGNTVFFLGNSNHTLLVDNRIVSNVSDSNYDLIAGDFAHNNTFLNSTFNLSRIRWDDANSNVTIQYYVTVNVTNGVSWQPVSGASVDIRNRNSSVLLSGALTNASGLTFQNVTVLFINSTGVTNHTLHNVSASRLGWSNSSNFTITGNANVVVLLSSACGTLTASATLLNDVTINGATCITLGGNSLALDLAGFTLTGNKTVNTYGVLAAGRTNVNVSSGNIRGFANGVLYSSTINSTVYNVTFFNHTGAFSGFNANNSNVSYSNVSYSDTNGIAFSGSQSVFLIGNTIQDNGPSGNVAGVLFEATNSSWLTSNSLLRNQNGFHFNNSFGNVVFGGSVINSTAVGLAYSNSPSSNLVSGVSVSGNYSNAAYSDVRMNANSSATLHDASFNKSRVSTDSAVANNATVSYTVHVNVTNSTSALANARVNFTSVGASVASISQLTNSTGFTTQNVTEYVQTTGLVYGVNLSTLNPYTVLVSLSGYDSNSSSQTLTAATQLNLRLSVPAAVVTTTSTGSGSTASATPTPTAAPVPSPTTSPSVPSPTPGVESGEPLPSPAAELGLPTAVPEQINQENVVVEVSAPSSGASDSASSGGVPVVVRRSLVVESSATGPRSTVLIEFENEGVVRLKDGRFTQRFPFIPCLGSDPALYEAQGFFFVPRPVEIKCGSAVVTWLFDNVEPGETVKAEVQVAGEVTREQVEQISTPKVIARSVERVEAVAVTPSASLSPTPGSFDWTLPAIGLGVVLLAAGAYFVLGRRKPDGI